MAGSKGICSAGKIAPKRWLRVISLGLLIVGFITPAAWAQTSLQPGAPIGVNNLAGGGKGASNPANKPAPAPPDAIPGAKARAPVIPASKSAADLAPNDALFDAINRGDIASARDALNRGADLNAVNLLGMTPMELSVDLGRNDISFLLLSMRGEGGGGAPVAVAHAAPAKAVIVTARGRAVSRSSGVPKPRPVAAKPVAAPKLFANDGGIPLPSAGFLGFGERSATN